MLINCDLGECLTPGPDTDVMPLIDMANIACGGHAGDDESMVKTIKLAKENNVKIGVHPSYEDQANFGRVGHQLNGDELYDLVYQQVSHFQNLCHNNNASLEYVKPHGALYHDMMENPLVLDTICRAIKAVDENLKLVVQAGVKNFGEGELALAKRGCPGVKNTNMAFLYEVFADRGYDGVEMLPRGEEGAVLDNADAIVEQYQRFLCEKSFKIDTICFHSDNSASVEALKRLDNA
ncbi:MAG TPA: LamB/YcsF family protein [Gammaproteobacteria bacterium]|nr:LamB/YcsF family protein [Gammaproteobacteria bacterium]